MANVDLSKWKTGGVVSRSGLEIEALANFEANDLSSVSITNKEFSVSGLTRYKGKSFSTTYILRGSFDLSDQDRWLIKSIRITMDAYGEISISGLSLGGDALANGSLDDQFLAGNDTIIGSPFADRLNGDSGKDRLTGGGEVPCIHGQARRGAFFGGTSSGQHRDRPICRHGNPIGWSRRHRSEFIDPVAHRSMLRPQRNRSWPAPAPG